MRRRREIRLLLPAPPARPWDRADLFRRAATFKPSTWFAKDAETAGALGAAARGWVNVGLDLLRCEFCGERLAATARRREKGNPPPTKKLVPFAPRLLPRRRVPLAHGPGL